MGMFTFVCHECGKTIKRFKPMVVTWFKDNEIKEQHRILNDLYCGESKGIWGAEKWWSVCDDITNGESENGLSVVHEGCYKKDMELKTSETNQQW